MGRQVFVVLVALFALIPGGQGPRASEHDQLVAKHAATHGVPEALVRRVIQIESRGNPRAVSAGNYGLMQIRLQTARAMGYSGDASGLLNADTNMTYAVRYLAGAYRAAGGNQAQAIRNYQRGYYGAAKARGFSPYAVASVSPQAAAPDPSMLAPQRVAMVSPQQPVFDRRAAREQQRLERQAALDARMVQQQTAKQARIVERQAALAARAEQREAILQQKVAREQARQQQRAEVEQAKAAAQASAPRAMAARRSPAPQYAWYNPMRYFKHPLHQVHPLPRER